jgi:hypothetical protein
MAFWRRGAKQSAAQAPGSLDRAASKDDMAHLEAFARSRHGVEAFVEPSTAVTATTVVLVASTGEWTRRRIAGPDAAREMGRRLAIPVYEAAVVGYPQRMRDWTAKRGHASAD